MNDLSDRTISTVKRISASLRPPMLDQFGLLAAIEWHVEEFQEHTGIACTVSSHMDAIHFDEHTSTALFRILQEALTNVARHAEATRVDIHIEGREDVWALTIKDNGKGVKDYQIADTKSLGIVGMRERALAVGGTLNVGSDPGGGTAVTVTVPKSEPDLG